MDTSQSVEISRAGRMVYFAPGDDGEIRGVSVYHAGRDLVFPDMERLRDFSRKHGWTVEFHDNNRNT